MGGCLEEAVGSEMGPGCKELWGDWGGPPAAVPWGPLIPWLRVPGMDPCGPAVTEQNPPEVVPGGKDPPLGWNRPPEASLCSQRAGFN